MQFIYNGTNIEIAKDSVLAMRTREVNEPHKSVSRSGTVHEKHCTQTDTAFSKRKIPSLLILKKKTIRLYIII